MFARGRTYSGESANNMVAHMVMTYKTTIAKNEATIRDIKSELRLTRTENEELTTKLDQLETDNTAMMRTISELRRSKSNQNYSQVKRELESLKLINRTQCTQITALKDQLIQANTNVSMLSRENEELTKTIIELRERKGSSSESPWIQQTNISSFDVTDHIEVRFDYCVLPDGTEYIDGRKYQDGKPTRKGICLSLEDFDTFLRHGRTAWSRVISGLFNYKNRRK